jgi:glycosyltransferase involved in cell wall biosynthesis
MRVLFVTGEFPPMQGGVGDYTRELGLALRSLGCEVHVVTSRQAGPVPGLTVHPIVDRWGWGSWRSLLDVIRACQPDVVHVQYQAAAYAMQPAIHFWPRRVRWLGASRPRTVVTFHDLKVPYLFPKAGPLRRWVVNELARQSDLAITTNRQDYEDLRHELGFPPALVPIGSNIAPPTSPPQAGGTEGGPNTPQAGGTEGGPNTPQAEGEHGEREAWRARWSAGPNNFLLCFFGFLNDRKGVDTLLHALKILVSDPPHSANPLLLFIGGQTGASDPTNIAYLAHIKVLIAELGLADRIRWTGYLPDEQVSASFWAADLCVLPFRDGASFLHGTFHAALAHGLPILTTRPHLPLPQLVHGENVFLVPPQDPEALASAIVHLAASPELRRTLAAGARALAEQFRWDKIAADTLDLYRTIGAV